MHCSIDIDKRTHNTIADIDRGLDRARDEDETIEIFAHKPSESVDIETLEHVFSGARDRGLRFVTYREMATGEAPGAGLAFGLDDSAVYDWVLIRDLMLQYDAHITFFVTRYGEMTAEDKAAIRQFAADGHDIEAHSVNHLHAPEYVENFGLDAYMANEVVPSIDVLRADGYDPVAYAYPFGQRTSEIDDAILQHVPIVRSVSYAWSGIQSPCPD